jgi:hypothetical protein
MEGYMILAGTYINESIIRWMELVLSDKGRGVHAEIRLEPDTQLQVECTVEEYCKALNISEQKQNMKGNGTDYLIKKLGEAEIRVMLVHSGANDDDRDDLNHVINLLNEVMAELKEGMA